MSSRITEPPGNRDMYSPGDTVLGHSPELVEHYRQLATRADQRRQALSGAGQSSPAEPAQQLPGVHVARQAAGREINRLQGEATRLERDLSVPPIGMTGQPDPYLIGRHRELQAGLEAVRTEISRLDGMTDHEAQVWASGRGVR